MRQTFKAICPDSRDLQTFEIVSDKGRTSGWCTRCRKTFPLDQLTDGKTDEEAAGRPPRRKKR